MACALGLLLLSHRQGNRLRVRKQLGPCHVLQVGHLGFREGPWSEARGPQLLGLPTYDRISPCPEFSFYESKFKSAMPNVIGTEFLMHPFGLIPGPVPAVLWWRCRDGTADLIKWGGGRGDLPSGSTGLLERVLDLGLGIPAMFRGTLTRHRWTPIAALIKHFPYDRVGQGWLLVWLWARHTLAV